jgi:acetoacetyl-CoA reductase
MAELKNTVAIVTGGSRGIGASIAKELAKQGVKIVINYNSNKDLADQVVADIKEIGGDAYAVQADVSNNQDSEKLIAEAVNQHVQKT